MAVDQDLLTIFANLMRMERYRAHAKHGATSMEQSGLLEHRRASILMEEAAECGRALNDHEHGTTQLLEHRADRVLIEDKLDEELIQTATMAYTWWANRRGDRLPHMVSDLNLHEVSFVDVPPHPSWRVESVGKMSEQPNPYDVAAAKIVWDKDGPVAIEIRGFRYPVARTGTRFTQTAPDA